MSLSCDIEAESGDRMRSLICSVDRPPVRARPTSADTAEGCRRGVRPGTALNLRRAVSRHLERDRRAGLSEAPPIADVSELRAGYASGVRMLPMPAVDRLQDCLWAGFIHSEHARSRRADP